MMENRKQVNFYRLALAEGKRFRMELSDDYRLTGTGGGVFTWLAPVYDSMDQNETWHRLVLSGIFRECKYEIMAAASNEDLREFLYAEERTADQIEEMLREQTFIRKVNTDDLLLHSLTGQYLYILIRVSGARVDSHFQIDGLHVEFPWGSFVEYLPEIYQMSGRDTFFERYMTVLQSMYEDQEREVDYVPDYLDYESTPEEHLPELASWTGDWSREQQYSSGQIRWLLKHLQEIQCGRGTGHVLEEMIALLVGRKARILEYFKWHDWMKKGTGLMEAYEKLYGREEDTFTVILDTSDMKHPPAKEKLLQLMEDYIPLGMNCNLVLLDWSSHMDTHCYLDKNSRLSIPEQADTSGFVLGGNYVLG